MLARFLMGYQRKMAGEWKKNPTASRPECVTTLHQEDIAVFKSEVEMMGHKNILEFGPGASTDVWLDLGLKVTTVEHDQQWYDVAKEKFGDRARVLKGEDEMPFLVPELDKDEKFDFAFVDAPQGFWPKRKVHKGYEDCSRFNTTLFALQHAPVVLLHDVVRGLERGTLNRLNRLGYEIEIIPVPYGMARITWPTDKTLSTAH